MQQHHTRQSHMRLPPHTNNIQIHPTPMLPGQPPTQQQQQPQPQQQQHLKLPTTQAAATSGAATPTAGSQTNQHNMQQAAMSNAPPHMRDQALNRANNHKHLPAATAIQHNQTSQMQKIRQQHQHLNHKSNANHNNNNINHKSQYGSHMNMQQQPQNNSLQTHNMGTLHQQQHQTAHRNVPNTHGQQHQFNTLPMKNHAPPPTALRQILPTNATRSHQHHQMQQHQHQQYGYNYTGSKQKYNTNTNSNSNSNNNTTKSTAATFSTPKAILQNPNRLAKSSTTLIRTNNAQTKKCNSKEINEEDIDAAHNISNDSVTAAATAAKDDSNSNDADSDNLSAQNENSEHILQKSDSNSEANKENVSELNECSNVSNNKILCNDDSIAKNAKEKTPMCLVNELARYNKISHQYRLTGEKGPAHSKRFTVTLKLGDEEYTAEGFKIKKAQHSAASQALEKTSYKHPIPKAIRNHDDSKPRPYIMPTVELNALAMKLGQQTYYLYDPRQMPPPISAADIHEHGMHDANMPAQHFSGTRGLPLPLNGTGHLMPLPPQQRLLNEASSYGPRRHFDGGFCGAPVPPPPPPTHMSNCPPQRPFGPPHRGGFPMMNRYQRYPMIPSTAPPPPGMPHMHHPHYGMLTTPYKITLIVGKQKFVGAGRTLQHAKHDAASRALQVLKAQQLEELKDELDDSMDENDVKSPISQVHEAGIKRNLTVHFKIIREDGPAHMRNFITACIMGSMVTEGEGHGKKVSKKRAAEKMLQEIKKLPPVCTPQKSPIKRSKTKTPSKLDSKDIVDSVERDGRGKREKKDRGRKVHEDKEKVSNDEECPITKLLQLMHQRKQKEPVFEYIAKSGSEKVKKREFIVEVTAQGFAARGTGVNKKIAKRNAAENLLHTLLEDENSSSDNDVTEEHNDLDDESPEFEVTNNQSSPIVKNSVKETSNAKSPKSLDNLELETVATTGQVPGILILRQNKKATAAKKKDIAATIATTTSTPSRPVRVTAKRIEVDSNEIETETSSKNQKENPKPVKQPVKIANANEKNVEKEQQPTTESLLSSTTTAPMSATQTAPVTNANSDTNVTTAAPTDKPSTSNTTSNTSSTGSSSAPSMMKQQLLYLANLLGFEVNFSDYPKGNHNEFLTIVALNTDPPQMCHGFGQNTNESQNDAARNALKILSDLGLNNAKSN